MKKQPEPPRGAECICGDISSHSDSPSPQKENWEEEFDKVFPKFDDLELSTLPDFTIEDKAIRQNKLLAIQRHNQKLGYIKDFIRSLLSKQREEVVRVIEQLQTTYPVSGSSNYQIGQNHGRQEFKRSVLAALEALL